MYYTGKTIKEFNEVESELFNIDNMAFAFMVAPEVLGVAGLMIAMSGGVEGLLLKRTILVGTKILGMAEPITQEDYTVMETAVEDSEYSFEKFTTAHEAEWEKFSAEKELEEKKSAEASATPETPEAVSEPAPETNEPENLAEGTSEKG